MARDSASELGFKKHTLRGRFRFEVEWRRRAEGWLNSNPDFKGCREHHFQQRFPLSTQHQLS